MDCETKDWVVVRLRTGEIKLVEAVILPVQGPGKILVPLLGEAETAAVDRVVNASCWCGAKRPARFRSGLPCIRCDGSRRADALGVAVLRDADRAFAGTIRPVDGSAWEYRIAAADGAPGAAGDTGRATTAQDAFDAILRLAAARGWAVDTRPSPILDTAD